MEALSDPRVMEHSTRGVQDEAGVKAWLQRHLDHHRRYGHGFMAVELKATGEHAGHAGLLIQEVEGEDLAAVSYFLRHAFWGRGLATEAALAVRDHAFGVLGKEELFSLIAPGNERSKRVAEKLGMAERRRAVRRGLEACVFGMTRERWVELTGA